MFSESDAHCRGELRLVQIGVGRDGVTEEGKEGVTVDAGVDEVRAGGEEPVLAANPNVPVEEILDTGASAEGKARRRLSGRALGSELVAPIVPTMNGRSCG